jgi:hypothetical protein
MRMDVERPLPIAFQNLPPDLSARLAAAKGTWVTRERPKNDRIARRSTTRS